MRPGILWGKRLKCLWACRSIRILMWNLRSLNLAKVFRGSWIIMLLMLLLLLFRNRSLFSRSLCCSLLSKLILILLRPRRLLRGSRLNRLKIFCLLLSLMFKWIISWLRLQSRLESLSLKTKYQRGSNMKMFVKNIL